MTRSSGFTSEQSPAAEAVGLPVLVPTTGGSAPLPDFVVRVTKLLPNWLRRCGVRRMDLDDAVQEASLEVLEKLGNRIGGVDHLGVGGLTEIEARHELMRIVSNVALRVRRRLQRENDRYSGAEPTDAMNPRDEEAWVEARALVLTAFGNLDKPTQALIIAHEVEGRTNLEIAARMQLKEDTVEKRVHSAKQRLRSEVEHLERGRVKLRSRGATMGWFGLAWQSSQPIDVIDVIDVIDAIDVIDVIDKALIGAVDEAVGSHPKVFGRGKKISSSLPHMPTTALMGALVFAPMAPSAAATTVPVLTVKRFVPVRVPPVAHSIPTTELQEDAGSDPRKETQNPFNVSPAPNAHGTKHKSDVAGSGKLPLGSSLKSSTESKKKDKGSAVRVPGSLIVSDVPESQD